MTKLNLGFMARAVLTACLLLPAGAAMAQDAAPASEAKQIKEFEKAERLTELRHKHLWLAYGAAWLIICGFMWRTHGMSRKTEGELVSLKKKIEALEAQDG
jgi:hypothetical protein